MKINQLQLRQFRNISHASLQLHPHLNIFIGKNGQGKTNLLESCVVLSHSRSYRIADENKMIQHQCHFAKIHCTIESKQKENLTVILSEEGKSLMINSLLQKKVSQFIGHLNIVLFVPSDCEFFTLAPRYRRNEINLELGKILQNYMAQLSEFLKLVKERNQCLKVRAEDEIMLEVLLDRIIEKEKFLLQARKTFVDKINESLTQYYHRLSEDSSSVIKMEYETFVDFDEISVLVEKAEKEATMQTASSTLSSSTFTSQTEQHGTQNHKTNPTKTKQFIACLEDEIRAVHLASKDKELLNKSMICGAHRDDFNFTVNGLPVKDVASQGQRRMIILAYKFALMKTIYDYTGQCPVVLLDDVFSELDQQKRINLLHCLPSEIQVLMTTTDLDTCRPYLTQDYRLYHVSNGEIKEEQHG